MIIEVRYTQYITADVEYICEEQGIKPNAVTYCYVKWNTLYLATASGEEFEVELNTDLEGDMKHPDAVILLSDEYTRIKDSIQHSDNPFVVETQEGEG